jgi:hypothetical protein
MPCCLDDRILLVRVSARTAHRGAHTPAKRKVMTARAAASPPAPRAARLALRGTNSTAARCRRPLVLLLSRCAQIQRVDPRRTRCRTGHGNDGQCASRRRLCSSCQYACGMLRSASTRPWLVHPLPFRIHAHTHASTLSCAQRAHLLKVHATKPIAASHTRGGLSHPCAIRRKHYPPRP